MIRKILNRFNAKTPMSFKGNELELDNWELSSFIIKKIIPVVGIRPFPLSELSLMVSAVAWTKPTHIFEWGTHIGKSARIFYETCKYLKYDTEIHSIDLPDEIDHVEHPHNKRGKLVKGKKNVFLHQGDGIDTAIEIYKGAQNIRALFYVDGDHSYETVYRELNAILTNVEDVFVILHDTFYQGKESNYNVGPYNAINDVLNLYPKKTVKRIDTLTGLPGMTFIYKI